jgi:hypothetical protein
MKLNVSARTLGGFARSSVSLRRSMLGVVVAVAVMAGVGACASRHNPKAGGGDQSIYVHLTNDLSSPSDVTVYAVTENGIRRLIGDVPPNKDKTLKIPSDVPPGSSFRLVAERSAISRPVVSQPVTATSDGLIIDWTLQTNSMWFPDTAS